MAQESGKPVVLITGASAGIGAATSRRFAAGGYRIVAVARRPEKLAELVAELSSLTEVRTLAVDVTDRSAAQRAVDIAMQAFGRLDCLVNNAGAGKWAPVHQTDDDTLDEVVEETLTSKQSERVGRLIDHDQAASMERKKREGYF